MYPHPSAPHRTRCSVSCRAGTLAAAVNIVSNNINRPHTQPPPHIQPPPHTTVPSSHHHERRSRRIGLNFGGVGVGVVGGVGVEDGIVSLDQQANDGCTAWCTGPGTRHH